MARLIFCFFAEDTGIFRENQFTATITQMSHAGHGSGDEQWGNTHEVLTELFRAMDMPVTHEGNLNDRYRCAAAIRPYADIFPYVNGGLFTGAAESPRFSRTASASVLAITEVVTCIVPTPGPAEISLAEAYAVSAAASEHYLLRQVTQLGRLDAYERVTDWLMEVRERLALAGLVDSDRFQMPLTQELIGDTLGLTSVHVNRTLQALRSDGLLELKGGYATILNVPRLESLVEKWPARVI